MAGMELEMMLRTTSTGPTWGEDEGLLHRYCITQLVLEQDIA